MKDYCQSYKEYSFGVVGRVFLIFFGLSGMMFVNQTTEERLGVRDIRLVNLSLLEKWR